MMVDCSRNLSLLGIPYNSRIRAQIPGGRMLLFRKPAFFDVAGVQCSNKPMDQQSSSFCAIEKSRKGLKKPRKKEHHLWKRKESAGSGQKAMNLVRIVSGLPHEKEAVYRALDEWVAWELDFPMLAAAKALRILKQKRQWLRVIQKPIDDSIGKRLKKFNNNSDLHLIRPLYDRESADLLEVQDYQLTVKGDSKVAKWMLSKGQGTTMATYDAVLLAFDQKGRTDEAESLWNMILHTHSRSISKRLFSRMVSLYDHHDMPEKIIEVFADMEELGVKPDEDTVRRVSRAFDRLGQEDKKNLVINRYGCKWKYIHFKGERVRVKRDLLVE